MVGIECYENLANAIILQAVADYKTIVKEIHKFKSRKDEIKREIAKKGVNLKKMHLYTEEELEEEYTNILEGKIEKMQSIENFFLSDYYISLSKTDGAAVLKELKQKIKTKYQIDCDLL